jgi:hypothetical protein
MPREIRADVAACGFLPESLHAPSRHELLGVLPLRCAPGQDDRSLLRVMMTDHCDPSRDSRFPLIGFSADGRNRHCSRVYFALDV